MASEYGPSGPYSMPFFEAVVVRLQVLDVSVTPEPAGLHES